VTSRGEMGELHAPAHATHDAAGHAHESYRPVFVGDRRRELDELLTRYPTKMAALLPALWMVQEDRGWVSEPAMAEVAAALELTPAYVKGVVTFYTMYHQHPVGRHFIQVCTTSPCNVSGAEEVARAFLRHTGCEELGVTSEDGRFTVIEVECLGACGFATPVLINNQFIESVTPERVPEILGGLT
jgi:NADH-quinone oxidoreductase E subunit